MGLRCKVLKNQKSGWTDLAYLASNFSIVAHSGVTVHAQPIFDRGQDFDQKVKHDSSFVKHDSSFVKHDSSFVKHESSFVMHLLEPAVKRCLNGVLCSLGVQYK